MLLLTTVLISVAYCTNAYMYDQRRAITRRRRACTCTPECIPCTGNIANSESTAPRRPSLPSLSQPPTTIVGRLRPASDDLESMRPSKRRILNSDYSPWDDQSWVKENRKDLDGPRYKYQIPTRSQRPSKPQPMKTHKCQHCPCDPSTPLSVRIKEKLHHDNGPYDFLWSASDDSDHSPPPGTNDEAARKETEPAQDTTKGVPHHNFNPIRPIIIHRPLPPPSDDESGSSSAEGVVDPEEEASYRRFPRLRFESHYSQGDKVVVDGPLSPQPEKWNHAHGVRLAEDVTAALQGTSSKLPPTSPPEPKLKTEAEVQVDRSENTTNKATSKDGVPISDAAQKPPKRHSSQLARPAPSNPSPLPGSFPEDEDDTKEAVVKKEDPTNSIPDQSRLSDRRALMGYRGPFETPTKQLATLKVSSSTDQNKRTPKASIFSTIRTERKTRYQRALDEREAAKDEYKIVALGDEWDRKVRHAVRNGTPDQRYSPSDFAKVVPRYAVPQGTSSWLNDAVINDYMALIARHGNKDDRPAQVPTYAAISSYLLTKIDGPKGVAGVDSRFVKRQTKTSGKSLLDIEKIFIPINLGSHWILCVVEPKLHRRITIYDSMSMPNSQRHAQKILAWLKHEIGTSMDQDEWTIEPVGKSPQQTNCDDCGVFTCTTARQIMLGQMEKNPYTAEIMPWQRKRIVAELVNGALLKAAES